MPRKLNMLNLAGFGMMAWDSRSPDPHRPYCYRSTDLPVFDRNLKALAEKIYINCLVAHVRGVHYSTEATISYQNIHPFCFPSAQITMAHNGDLFRIGAIRHGLFSEMRPDIAAHISGTTDSEVVYALLLSQLDDPWGRLDPGEMIRALPRVLAIIAHWRKKHDISISSSLNLFFSDGETVCALRYCFDFGRYAVVHPKKVHEANLSFLSLWYTSGRAFGFHEDEWKMIGGSAGADSIIIASEPLTVDTTRWLEVPEYSLLVATTAAGALAVDVHPMQP